MGKFGCTQIQTSSSCSSEKKKNLVFFLGFEYFAQRPFDKNGQKIFLARRETLLAKKGGYSGELGGVLGSNVPLAMLIDP